MLAEAIEKAEPRLRSEIVGALREAKKTIEEAEGMAYSLITMNLKI